MIPLIQLKQTTSVFLTAVGLFVFLPQMQAAPQVSPEPDGCYGNFTTAGGCNAVAGLSTGAANTGIGWYSLFSAGASNFNTGVGSGTLALNAGDSNTAVGAAALLLNTTGTQNAAVGTASLVHNDTGGFNNAVGASRSLTTPQESSTMRMAVKRSTPMWMIPKIMPSVISPCSTTRPVP